MGDHLNLSGASNSPDGYNPLEHSGEVLVVRSADGDVSRERRQRHTEGDGSDGQEETGFGQSFRPGAVQSQDQSPEGAQYCGPSGNQLSPSARSQSGKSEENDELFSPVRTLKFGEGEDSASYAGSDIRFGGAGVEDSGFVSQLSRGMDRGDGAYAESRSPPMLSSMRVVEGHVSPPGDLLGARASSGFSMSGNSSTKDEDFVPLESDEESEQNDQNLYDSLERAKGEEDKEAEVDERRPVQDMEFPHGLDALNRSLQSERLEQQLIQNHGFPSNNNFAEGRGFLDHSRHSEGWTEHRPGHQAGFPRGLDALSMSSWPENQRGNQGNSHGLPSHLAFLEDYPDTKCDEHHSLPQDSSGGVSTLGRQRSNSTGAAVPRLMPTAPAVSGHGSSGDLDYFPASPPREGMTTPPLTEFSLSPHSRSPLGPRGGFSTSPRGCGSGSADVPSPQQSSSQQIGVRPTVHDGDGASSRTSVTVTIPQMSMNFSNSALGTDSQPFPDVSHPGNEQLESCQQLRDISSSLNAARSSNSSEEKGGGSDSEGQGSRGADANANARISGRAVPKLKGFGNGRDFKPKKSNNDLDVCPRLSRTQQRMDQMQASQHNTGSLARPPAHVTSVGGHPPPHAPQPKPSGMQRSASQPIPPGLQRQPAQPIGVGRGSSISASHFPKSSATYSKVASHPKDRVGVQEHKSSRADSHPQGVGQSAGAREAAGGEGGARGGRGGRGGGGGETVKPSHSQESMAIGRHVPGTSLPTGATGRERFARPPSPHGPPSPHSSLGEFSPPQERGPVPGSRAEAGPSSHSGGGSQGQRTSGKNLWMQSSHLENEEILQSFSGIESDLQGMENVRSHLQQMLSMNHTSPRGSKRDLDVNGSVSDLLLDSHHHSPRGAPGGMEDMLHNRSAPLTMDDDVSELFESFPNFSSKLFSHRPEPPRQDTSTHGEYQYLQRCLEKERLRRKHCEEQIQHLNAKLLEVQEQLAVAVSTDKRKDIMIEQLDKQLAKVVEGWKQREADKDAYLRKLLNEKQLHQERFEKQEKTIAEFETEMADVVQQLREERDKSANAINNAKMQLAERTREKSRAEELLAAERERASLIQQEWEQLKEARDLAERRADQIQERLHREQDDWYKREQELIQQIDTFKDSNMKALQLEKAKVEEARKKKEELEERLEEAQTVIRKLELDMDTLARQKESMKVEMAIQEAKHESSLRKLESDMQVQMEKELSEQATKHLKEMERVREELQERHKTAINDIHRRHQRDLDKQLQKFRDDAQIREDDVRAQIRELEERLQQYRDENTALKHGKQKLESQRMEVLNKLQFIMQSQWNETVSLLACSPQKKDLSQNPLHASTGVLHNTSAMSQLSGVGPSGSNHLNFSFMSQSELGASMSQNDLPAPLPAPSSGAPLPPSSSGQVSMAPSQSSNLMSASLHHQMQAGNSASVSVSPSAANTQATASAPPSQSPSQQQQDEQTRLQSYLRELKDLQGKYAQGTDVSMSAMSQDTNCSNTRAPPLPRQSTPPPSHPLPPNPPNPGEGRTMSAQDISFSEQLLAFLNSSNLPVNVHGYLLGQSNASNNQSFLSEASIPTHPPTHPPTAIMIRPPLQQSHVGGSGPHRGPPSPRKKSTRGRPAPRPVSEDDGSDSWEDDDDSQELIRPFQSYGQSPPIKQGGRERGLMERGASQTTSEAGSMDIADLSGVLEESVHKISERVELHETRQTELQRYIKMLLEKPPGSPMEGGEGADPYAPESDVLETSRDLTGEFDLNDTAQAAQLQRELSRLQQLRESQQSSGTASSELPERDLSRRAAAPKPQVAGVEGMAGVLQPEQLAEISRLVEQCRLQPGQGQPAASSSEQAAAQLRQLLLNTQRNEGPAAHTSPKGSPKRQGQRSRDSSQQRRAAAVKSTPLSRDMPSRLEAGADNSRQAKAGGAKKQDRKMAAVKPTPSKSRTSKSGSAWK